MKHASHPDIVKRLNRAAGHIRSIVGMIEDHRPCLEIAQQLHAVACALDNAKEAFVHDHINNCLEEAVLGGADGKAALSEFKKITKYL